MVAVEASELSRTRRALFLGLVAVLPLHTVFFSAWISWKPFIGLLVVIAGMDAAHGWRSRSWPWHVPASMALAAFLGLAAISWPGGGSGTDRFLRLLLSLGVGGAVLLVTERSLRGPGVWERTLKVAFWTGAAMAATAFVFVLLSVGAFGADSIEAVNDLPGVERVFKPAFLDGFVALTNWHQDPGYAAAWMNLWIVIVIAASIRGFGSGRTWGDATVVGGLAFGVVMTLNRTGWAGLALAVAASGALYVRAGWIRRPEILRLLGMAALMATLAIGVVVLADRPDVGGDVDTEFGLRIDQIQSLLGLEDPPESGAAGAAAFEGGEERFAVWPEYVEFFASNPLRGVGLGTGWETNSLGQEPHNIVLELLGETGLAGFLGFLGVLLVVLARGRGPIGTAALIVALATAMTQTVLFEATWWLAAGLFLGGRWDRTPELA